MRQQVQPLLPALTVALASLSFVVTVKSPLYLFIYINTKFQYTLMDQFKPSGCCTTNLIVVLELLIRPTISP